MYLRILFIAIGLTGIGFPLKVTAQESVGDSLSWLQKRLAKRKIKAKKNAEKFDNYTALGISLSNNSIQDTKMALPIYSGPGVGIRHDFIQLSNTMWSSSRFEASYAIPGQQGADGTLTNINIKYRLAYARKLMTDAHIYLGGAIDLWEQLRIYPPLGNSSINNDFVLGLNPMAMLRKERKVFKRSGVIFTRIDFNLLSFVNRFPTYNVGSRDFNYFVLPVGAFNRFRFECGFHTLRKWSNENRIGLEYTWDFYAMNEPDNQFKVRAAQHLLTCTFFFKTR